MPARQAIFRSDPVDLPAAPAVSVSCPVPPSPPPGSYGKPEQWPAAATTLRQSHRANASVVAVGNVERLAVGADRHTARRAEARLGGRAAVTALSDVARTGHRRDRAVSRHLAHALVGGIGNVHRAVGRDGHAFWCVEQRRRRCLAITAEAGGGAGAGESGDDAPRVDPPDAGIAHVVDVDRSIRTDVDGVWLIERG